MFPEDMKHPMTSNAAVPRQPTIDHIIPRSKGGGDEPKNLRWTCYQCNQQKGDKWHDTLSFGVEVVDIIIIAKPPK